MSLFCVYRGILCIGNKENGDESKNRLIYWVPNIGLRLVSPILVLRMRIIEGHFFT